MLATPWNNKWLITSRYILMERFSAITNWKCRDVSLNMSKSSLKYSQLLSLKIINVRRPGNSEKLHETGHKGI